jgi:TolB-like protein/class 3 adenylate cyclase
MTEERPVERRLSAILAADVAGYSRLMHHEEEATHAKLRSLLTDAVTPAISQHRGRVVKNTGDGFLAEFPSAVEAVRAAVQFQTRIKEITAADGEGRRIAFRVGINVGDVIVEPHDIFGDGVNIAARLESIAKPGGICVSSSAYDHIRGKVGVEFSDLGEQSLKNIASPVRAYAVAWNDPDPAAQVVSAAPSTLARPRLSIVVLPFANLSGDIEQDYFVDGVTASLTTDLSRIRGSFVIGRSTAFTYKGKAFDFKRIGRELNIRYVLEGSVQRSGNRLRVNVQLIDAENGQYLWAERFDKPVADLFDMQDEIVARLANALNAEMIAAEARRSEHSTNPDAMDLNFQGFAWSYRGVEHMSEARGFFERALAIDHGSVGALVGLAIVDLTIGASLLADDHAVYLSAAEANAIKALSLAPDHAPAHRILGGVYIFTNRAAQGIAECERALELDCNLVGAHSAIGIAKYFMGRAAETEGHIVEALRLSPRDVFAHRWMHIAGMAKIQVGADAEAAAWLRRSIEANRNFSPAHFWFAAALGLLGALDEARSAAKAGLTLDPIFTISRVLRSQASDNPSYLAGRERVCEGMRLAGIPEG